MNENTNPEVKETVTEEVKKEEKPKKETRQEKKEREKEEKSKLEYRVEQPEEEKKKKEPIPKEDYIWYIGAFIFLILAFFPLILKNTEQSYDIEREKREKEKIEEEQKNVGSELLNCNKTFNDSNYSYNVSILSTYQNKVVQKTEITYKINQSGTSEAIINIPEYNELSNIVAKQGAIEVSETKGEYKVTIYYDKDEELRKNVKLSAHNMNLEKQKAEYNSMNYTCNS